MDSILCEWVFLIKATTIEIVPHSLGFSSLEIMKKYINIILKE